LREDRKEIGKNVGKRGKNGEKSRGGYPRQGVFREGRF
jgi:hypothetical protein